MTAPATEKTPDQTPTLASLITEQVKGLSGRLFVLIIAFVMLCEVLIYVPSIANFRHNFLAERLSAAKIATLALEASDEPTLPEQLRRELLVNAEVLGVSMKRGDRRMLILSPAMPKSPDASYDLRSEGVLTMVWNAFGTLTAKPGRIIRVFGESHIGEMEVVDIIIPEKPLRVAMYNYSGRILGLSIFISLMTAALVFMGLYFLFVRRMQALTQNMTAFRAAPEDITRVIKPSGSTDEIGVAEVELAAMQQDIRAALHQRSHLAALGTAVSKINHDLRNILASSQLVVDRLANVEDPTVERLAPRLLKSIDRAVKLTTETLKFGKAEEPAPAPQIINLRSVLEEARQTALEATEGTVIWENEQTTDLQAYADPDQLFRILLNLGRNAAQAIEASGEPGKISVIAHKGHSNIEIDMSDTGPGIPQRAQDHLFEAFSGSVRQGGTGLGLAISRELARLHGGDVSLITTGGDGTTFRVTLPTDESGA